MAKAPHEDELKLAPAIQAALKVRAEMKAEGASADGDALLEEAVRKHWPHAREWHYLCDGCDDTGWIVYHCTVKARCGREFCARHDAMEGTHYEHTYVRPCMCVKGRANQPKPAKSTDPGDATSKPQKTWKRLIP